MTFFWDEEPVKAERRVTVARSLPKPPITWTAPAEFPSLSGVKRISIDVETRDEQLSTRGPGVIHRGGYIVGLALGFDDRRFYFPTRHEGGGNIDEATVKRWAQSELNRFTGEVVGARLIYDLECLTTWGLDLSKCTLHDVQIIEPLLNENRRKFNLDALSMDYLGEGKDDALLEQAGRAYGFNTRRELMSNLWQLPAGYAGPYAEGDVDRPLRILEQQLPRLEEEGLMDIYRVEQKLPWVLLPMRLRGVKVDINKAETVREALKIRLNEVLAHLRRLAGSRAELMAPDSFIKAIDERGLKYPLTAKTRKPSITQDWLKANETDELVGTITKGRRLFTTINTFIDGHILGHHVNGRIHCEFNQLKSDEGGTIARFASSNPNLQNVPARDDELAPLVRGMFIPEEGERWARADYSQIEYRLMVHFAVGTGAAEARRLYNEEPETDFHRLCARFLGVDPEDKFMRKRVKNVNFCKVYGGGAETIAATMGCSKDEAMKFVRRYDRELPFVKETFERAMSWAQRRGYVVTIMNRRQRFPLWEPKGSTVHANLRRTREEALADFGPPVCRAYIRTALNKKLQCSAADLIKKAMVDAYNAGITAPDAMGAFLLTVHDELDCSVPNTPRAAEAYKELKHIMENAATLRVPIFVDIEQGNNWGECL